MAHTHFLESYKGYSLHRFNTGVAVCNEANGTWACLVDTVYTSGAFRRVNFPTLAEAKFWIDGGCIASNLAWKPLSFVSDDGK